MTPDKRTRIGPYFDERLADELAERLLRAAAEGCCMDAPWRGRCCQYHSGYRDGLDAALEALSGRPI